MTSVIGCWIGWRPLAWWMTPTSPTEWVRSRRAHSGKSKRALAAELHAKGVDNDIITTALGGLDAAAERERAEQLVRAKLRREVLGEDDSAGEPQAGGDAGASWVQPDAGG